VWLRDARLPACAWLCLAVAGGQLRQLRQLSQLCLAVAGDQLRQLRQLSLAVPGCGGGSVATVASVEPGCAWLWRGDLQVLRAGVKLRTPVVGHLEAGEVVAVTRSSGNRCAS
jgi:hypothetical protein